MQTKKVQPSIHSINFMSSPLLFGTRCIRLTMVTLGILTIGNILSLAQGNISAQITINRIDGVSPLYIAFDASATTHTDTSIDSFHDLFYVWDFDDTGSGTWPTDGKSKNKEFGPLAGHIFESPGLHNVQLIVRDESGNSDTVLTSINVLDPDSVYSGTNTICVGNPAGGSVLPGAGGCPSGALAVQSSDFDGALATHYGLNKRVLFRRGDTFSSDTSHELDNQGPATIGAFGSGSKPVINATPTSIVQVKTARDQRLMDLRFEMGGIANAVVSAVGTGEKSQITMLRLDAIDNAYNAFIFHFGPQLPTIVHNQLALVESTVDDLGNGQQTVFWFCERSYIAGNRFTKVSSDADHIIRIGFFQNLVVEHNEILFGTPGACHVFKLAGNDALESGFTNMAEPFRLGPLVFSDNRLEGGSNCVPFGGYNIPRSGVLTDIIVERNYFNDGPHCMMLEVDGWQGGSVRNNVLVRDTGACPAIVVQAGNSGMAPRNVRVYNNSCADLRSNNSDCIRIFASAGTNGLVARNNLAWGSTFVLRDLTSGITKSNNFLASSNPYVDATATFDEPTDFAINSSGAEVANIIDAGFSVPVWLDNTLTSRPQGAGWDVGGFEYLIPTSDKNDPEPAQPMVNIYPNPNTGKFILIMDVEQNTRIRVKLFQLDGQMIFTTKEVVNTFGNYKQQVDLSSFAKGIYYVQLITDEGVYTRKVVYH